MSDKIAVHVPHQLLSEAVQRKLFDMGYKWNGAKYPVMKEYTEAYISLNIEHKAILHTHNKKWLIAEGYTILTVDEFFKREEEPPEVTIGLLAKTKVTGDTEGFLIEEMYITWKEYDQIGTLRPGKEGSES